MKDEFGTAPVRDSYFALCSTQLTSDLENVSGFIQKAQYPGGYEPLPKRSGQYKSSLIDLEALRGDRAQA